MPKVAFVGAGSSPTRLRVKTVEPAPTNAIFGISGGRAGAGES